VVAHWFTVSSGVLGYRSRAVVHVGYRSSTGIQEYYRGTGKVQWYRGTGVEEFFSFAGVQV
jgi:hypothetical protein